MAIVADGHCVKVVALRARARCQVCDSKLPPRTEAFWDEETGTAVCLTCARTSGIEEAAAVAPPAPVPPAPPPTAQTKPEQFPEFLPEALPEPLPDVGPASVDSPLTFEPPADDATPPLRPPLDTPVAARPPLQATRDRRPPRAEVEDRHPPLSFENQSPLPPRLPAAPVLPPRDPVVGPDASVPPADPGAGAEPDVDDEPQWGQPESSSTSPEPVEDQSRHVRASAGLIGRLRNVGRNQDTSGLVDGDVLVDDLPVGEGIERGDPGDSPVGRTLEAARASGIEVLHHLAIGPTEQIDHLAVAVNGLWVIRSEAALTGPLERRDLGDWFTADPRLYVGDTDRSDLVNDARDRAVTLRWFLASTSFAEIPVRPVVAFGGVPAGWVSGPFSLAGVSVTWGSKLLEPMQDPVMVDKVTRAQLLQLLIDSARLH